MAQQGLSIYLQGFSIFPPRAESVFAPVGAILISAVPFGIVGWYALFWMLYWSAVR